MGRIKASRVKSSKVKSLKIKASKKHRPGKRALKKKGPARTKFTSVKSNLNFIDSWDLGNILLEPFFASSADDENGELLLSVLKKAA